MTRTHLWRRRAALALLGLATALPLAAQTPSGAWPAKPIRLLLGFAPGAIFGFVRWASNDYGTVSSRIDILQAVDRFAPYQTQPFVRPGGELLLSVHGWPKVERVLQRIHQINAKAQLIAATHGALPKEVWLDINAFQLDDTLQLNSDVYQAQPSAISPQNATVSNLHLTHFTAAPTPSWEDDIQSYVFEAGELDLMKLDVFLETLVEQYGNDMLRYKGVLAIHGEPRPLIVQGVHKVVGFDYGAAFTQKRRSLLIVIARRIPYETLKQDFLKTQVSMALN